MINIIIAFITIILWLIIFIFKPYCSTKSKFWTKFWVTIFCIIGGCCGFFTCQAIIYLCGLPTIIK